MGMVKEPEPTVLATEEPDTVPSSALVMTATLAGPPRCLPAMALDRSMKNSPTPVFSRKAPKRMNRKMKVELAPTGAPKIPSWVKKRCLMICRTLYPRLPIKPGMFRPIRPVRTNTAAMVTIGMPTTRLQASASSRTAAPPMRY